MELTDEGVVDLVEWFVAEDTGGGGRKEVLRVLPDG